MGDCDILLLVVLVASCSASDPKQSNLLPPGPGQDGAAGQGPTRRPGDPPGGTEDAGQLPGDGAAPVALDAPPASVLDAPSTLDSASTSQTPDTSASPPPDTSTSPAPDAARLVDVGVTWDANLLLTDCGITKPWAPKKSYPKNEFALNYGHIFQCLGEPPNRNAPSPFSDCKSPDYEPGKPGGPWADAWYDSGVCR